MNQGHKRILLVGGSGFLGTTLHNCFQRGGFHVAATGRSASQSSPLVPLDLEKPISPQIRRELLQGAYTHGLLCAATTDVEKCFRNPERSRRTNVDSPLELLALFREFNVKPVFFSSDLVFANSRDFYTEEDSPGPTTLYGRQKLEIEESIQKNFEDFLIFRTSKLMSMNLHSRNIVTPIVRAAQRNEIYKAFRDQFITPVFVEDVTRLVGFSIRAELGGIYHLACKERLSRVDLAQLVCKTLHLPSAGIQEISARDITFSEPRGLNFTLCSAKISQATGLGFTNTESGLQLLAKTLLRNQPHIATENARG